MKKILFTFLLLIAPMFNAWGVIGGGVINPGQQTIMDTCTNVKNWTEGVPQTGDTWYFNNDAECKLYRKAATCNNLFQPPKSYDFSCGAGCYWEPSTSNNSLIVSTKPGSCKKCPEGYWSNQYMQGAKKDCYAINQVYYPSSDDEHKYCKATACQKGTNAELKDGVRVCTGGGVFGNKNLCVCEDKYYKQGTECKKCPKDNITLSTFSKVYYQQGGITEKALNLSDKGINSCALYGADDEPEHTDKTGTFKISKGSFCYY